ncbi:MAG: hypothetical protein HC913_17605 [Microscillaceae bacterium]|nr:hypothetical protein [Microscillaceae bacterium]
MRKSIIKIFSTIFPNQVLNFAYNQLTNPQFKKLRQNEIEVLDTSQKETLKFQDFDIQLYTWQGGLDKVLLIHGWEGQAGNFADKRYWAMIYATYIKFINGRSFFFTNFYCGLGLIYASATRFGEFSSKRTWASFKENQQKL